MTSFQEHANTGILDLLWERHPENERRFSIRIPDTVIYRNKVPIRYYFTSKDGQIKRKSAANNTTSAIEERFKPAEVVVKAAVPAGEDGTPASEAKTVELDIAGVWHGGVLTDDRVPVQRRTPEGTLIPLCLGLDTLLTLSDASSVAELEATPGLDQPRARYIAGKEDLAYFLRDVKKEETGMLQRFVLPRSGNNEVLRCCWSPYAGMTTTDRRVCTKRLLDMKHSSVDSRAVTYENAGKGSSASQELCRSDFLVSSMVRICEEMAGHVAAVTRRLVFITYMECHFKVDNKERLTLLWVSNVKTRVGQNPFPSGPPTLGRTLSTNGMSVPRTARSGPGRPLSSGTAHTGVTRPKSGEQSTNRDLTTPSYREVTEDGTSFLSSPRSRAQSRVARSPRRLAPPALDTRDENGEETTEAVTHAVHVLMADARPRALHPLGSRKVPPVVAEGQPEGVGRPQKSAFEAPTVNVLPLSGQAAHAKAAAQGERERYASFVGMTVAYSPKWECPSCGQSATAAELQPVPARTVIAHYTALLTSLRLRPRELEADDDVDVVSAQSGRAKGLVKAAVDPTEDSLERARRRNSDALPLDCYWPVYNHGYDRIKYSAGGVGIHFAYVMPQGHVRAPKPLPHSLADYMDRWLFMRSMLGAQSTPEAAAGTGNAGKGSPSRSSRAAPADAVTFVSSVASAGQAKSLFAGILARGGSMEQPEPHGRTGRRGSVTKAPSRCPSPQVRHRRVRQGAGGRGGQEGAGQG